MTDQTKLEPCPFCGKEATRIRPNVHTGLLQIQCDDCWATSVTSTNRAVVIAAWNRRAGKDASGEAARTNNATVARRITEIQRERDAAARAMLAALKEKKRVDGNANRTLPEIEAANRAAYFAIAQAEAAGIATGEGK
jgi:Lar family restriction alleviation protein